MFGQAGGKVGKNVNKSASYSTKNIEIYCTSMLYLKEHAICPSIHIHK